MMNTFKASEAALLTSGIAMLSFVGRTLLDHSYVYPEFGIAMPELLPVTLGELAFFGGWIWGLVAAGRGSRKALIALLIYNLLLLLFGISTLTMLCPSPCGTAWPLGELLIWSNMVIGLTATLLVLRQFVRCADPGMERFVQGADLR